MNTIQNRREAAAWQKKFDARAPKAGDPAQDFTLYDIHGKNPIKLSDFRKKKPVVLIFGSFT